MGNKDTYSHNRKDSSFLDHISLDKAIPEEMHTRLKERIDRLGEETVRKAFLNLQKNSKGSKANRGGEKIQRRQGQ